MVRLDGFFSVQVGYCPGDLEDLVVSPGRDAEFQYGQF
jgi:hypothetical protein